MCNFRKIESKATPRAENRENKGCFLSVFQTIINNKTQPRLQPALGRYPLSQRLNAGAAATIRVRRTHYTRAENVMNDAKLVLKMCRTSENSCGKRDE